LLIPSTYHDTNETFFEEFQREREEEDALNDSAESESKNEDAIEESPEPKNDDRENL
jgi:hypothetical protein